MMYCNAMTLSLTPTLACRELTHVDMLGGTSSVHKHHVDTTVKIKMRQNQFVQVTITLYIPLFAAYENRQHAIQGHL